MNFTSRLFHPYRKCTRGGSRIWERGGGGGGGGGQGCRRPADLSGRTFWPDLQAGTRPERPLIKVI